MIEQTDRSLQSTIHQARMQHILILAGLNYCRQAQVREQLIFAAVNCDDSLVSRAIVEAHLGKHWIDVEGLQLTLPHLSLEFVNIKPGNGGFANKTGLALAMNDFLVFRDA